MNRAYRIVWSEARQAFVVTHEKAKANGKPSSTRKAVASAVVMVLAALAATPALALPTSSCVGGAISISAAETLACSLTSGSSLIVTNTGSISVPSGSAAISVTSGSSIGSITNNGAISGGGTGTGTGTGILIIGGSSASSAGSITNSGTITGDNGIIIVNGGITGSLTNSGGINASNSGIYLRSATIGGSITNSGTITGKIYLSSGSSIGSLVNDGGGIISSSGVGITVRSSSIGGGITNNGEISGGSSAGISISSGGSVGSITNSGTISGAVLGVDIVGSSSSIDGGITNSGTISASGAGIRIVSSGSVGGITNSGTISASSSSGAAINLGSSGSIVGSITNSGTISGGSGIYIHLFSSITGGITNSGTISASGNGNGITIYSVSSIGGSITNSGTISGGSYAILVDGSSTLANIDIAGNDTASFVGEVLAPNTAVTVLNGATYTMQGGELFTLNGTSTGFANNGTLGVAAGGTGTITGNYTQAANATFRTGASSNANYGKLVVSGTATLPAAAKIDVNVAGVNTLAAGQTLAGIISAGTLSASTFAVTDNSALFNFTAAVNGNAIDLTTQLGITAAGSTGASGNTAATGAATVFDTLLSGSATGTADMSTVTTALGQLATQQQVSDAVGQTLPLMTGGMAQATTANLNGVNRVVQARMEEHRGLSSGDGFVENGKGWFKPVGSWADQKNSNGAFGYTAETYGVVLGADGERSDVSRMGAAFGYTHSLVHGNSGAQSAKVDSYQFVVYGSRSLNDSMEYNWQADYGYNQNKGSRYIAFVNRTAAADYSSQALHIGTGIGKTMAWKDKTSFVPSIRADYTRIAEGAYTETGANALNLVVASKTTEELILSVDGKLAHSLSDASTLTANLGLGYDAMSKQNSITATYAGGGAAFTTNGIKPSATLARIGMGYVHSTDSGMEITARYDAEARTGFTAQTVSAKLRMAF